MAKRHEGDFEIKAVEQEELQAPLLRLDKGLTPTTKAATSPGALEDSGS